MRLFAMMLVFVGIAAHPSYAQQTPQVAHDPLIVWQGGVTAVAASVPACNGVFGVGDLGTAIFRPKLDIAEPSSAISILFPRSAAIYVRTGGTGSAKMNGQGTYRGTLISERAGLREGFTGVFNFVVVPANPVATTTFVTIQGTIGNFAGVSGCTITIRGSFGRRP